MKAALQLQPHDEAEEPGAPSASASAQCKCKDHGSHI
jgi:hypothetical protein